MQLHKYTVELACEDVCWFNGVLLYSWFKWFILYTHTTMDVPLLYLQAVTRQCYQVLLILLNSNPTEHLCFDRETQHVIQKYKKQILSKKKHETNKTRHCYTGFHNSLGQCLHLLRKCPLLKDQLTKLFCQILYRGCFTGTSFSHQQHRFLVTYTHCNSLQQHTGLTSVGKTALLSESYT